MPDSHAYTHVGASITSLSAEIFQCIAFKSLSAWLRITTDSKFASHRQIHLTNDQ